MRDFWRHSGYHLLERDARGYLKVSDDLLRAYLNRPEVRPVEESCAAERALHARLMEDPRHAVEEGELTRLADPDAIDNYRIVLAFRDRLVDAGTLEECYLEIFQQAGAERPVPVPPLFLDQMAQIILRGVLEGSEDPLRLRAGELFFRPQKVTIADGHVMAADEEIVEMYASSGGFGSLGQLLVQAQTPLRTMELEVLTAENAEIYWQRDEKHDLVLNLNFSGDGLDALCRVLEAWVAHFFSIKVSIQPVQQITDERWVWHCGLDLEASAMLNDLYNGKEVGEARLARLLSLFRLDFDDPSVMLPAVAGRPVYLAMAVNEQNLLRLKPQNLLLNLPLGERA